MATTINDAGPFRCVSDNRDVHPSPSDSNHLTELTPEAFNQLNGSKNAAHILVTVPMPIRTPRLVIRPKQVGDGALTASAVAETWEDLHRWMGWAETLADHTAERKEIRTREAMASFRLREEFNLIGIEVESGKPVIWCGFHGMDWKAHYCEMGFWVRRSAQGRGFATEASNALLRYAFGALGMSRVGVTHSRGNEASRRVIEKLGFSFEGMMREANVLPGGRVADRCCYARLDAEGLPPLEVRWGED